MKKIFFITLIINLIFIFSLLTPQLVLANNDIAIVNATNISASPTETIEGSFILSNRNLTLNLTNIACSASISDWNTQITGSCPIILINNTNTTVSFSVTVPRYTPKGIYIGSVAVNGTFIDNTTSRNVSANAQFSVNVSATPNIAIEWLRFPVRIYQDENDTIELNITNTGNVLLSTDINIQQ